MFCILLLILSGLPLSAQPVRTDAPRLKLDSLLPPYHTYTYMSGLRDTVGKDSLPAKTVFPREEGRLRHDEPARKSYFPFLFLGGLLLICVVKIIEPGYFGQLVPAVGNSEKIMDLFQEGRFGFNFVNLLLDLLFILGLGCLVTGLFFAEGADNFFWVLVFTFGAYFLKIVLIQFLAYLFFNEIDALQHVLLQLLYTRVMAVFLLPAAFIAFYQDWVGVDEALRILFLALLATYLWYLVKLLARMKLQGVSGLFYLFLYLCILEISPVLILIKNFIR